MSWNRKIVLLIILNVSLFITTFLNEMVITIFPAYKTNHIIKTNKTAIYRSNDDNDNINNTTDYYRNNYNNINNYNYTIANRPYEIDNSKVASLLGIKYATQIIAFPISGILTDQISPGLIMLIGLILESVSYFFYGTSESFVVVCIARFIDGIGSAFYSTAGLTLIYIVTPSNKFRNKLITINSICTFIAISTAPLAAGASYQYTLLWTANPNIARWVTFSFIGPLLIIITIISFPFAFYTNNNKDNQRKDFINYLKPRLTNTNARFTHIGIIVKDPYILITITYIAVFSIPLTSFQSTLPIYMSRRFGSDETKQGIVWFGCMSSIPGFLLGSIVYHKLMDRCWLVCMINLQIVGLASMLMMFVKPWWTTSIILGIINFCGSMIEVILIPFIAILIDQRYTGNYGGSSSLTLLSYTLSGILGTFPMGFIVEKTDFSVLCYILALLCIPFSPTILFCRKYFKKMELIYSVTENEND